MQTFKSTFSQKEWGLEIRNLRLLLKVNRRVRVNETSPSKNFIYTEAWMSIWRVKEKEKKKHYEIGKSNIMPLIQ